MSQAAGKGAGIDRDPVPCIPAIGSLRRSGRYRIIDPDNYVGSAVGISSEKVLSEDQERKAHQDTKCFTHSATSLPAPADRKNQKGSLNPVSVGRVSCVGVRLTDISAVSAATFQQIAGAEKSTNIAPGGI